VARGKFLSIEGGEGAGKSTQVRMLADSLAAAGYDVVVTHEPGATDVGRRLREVLLDPANVSLSPVAEAMLYAADRAQHVEAVLRPALARGAIVICDRYVDSSIAYQAYGRQLSEPEVRRLSRWATDGLLPDLTVLLDIDPGVGLGRATTELDRLESETVEFHRRVRAGFRSLARAGRDRYVVLDSTDAPERVHRAVRDAIAALLSDATLVHRDEVADTLAEL
jgi:dTMP kinase